MAFRNMRWHPQSFVTDLPRNGAVVQVFRDNWWVVNDKGEVAIYGQTSPQCNPYPEIADKVVGATKEAVGRVLIPMAFVHFSEGE